jgi:hypothetical protein
MCHTAHHSRMVRMAARRLLAAIVAGLVLLCSPELAHADRGGHAVPPPARGGEALEPIGDLDAWICIHSHEAAWNDAGSPYWGGLQMDRDFMRSWGRDMLARYGGRLADAWTPRDQMVVAERARVVRGYTPWPNTARMCGLL